MSQDTQESPVTVRLDKWLWYARFFKSRSLATRLVQARKVRVNSVIAGKASASVKAEDVLTFPQAKNIRVVRIIAVGDRRGPAPEARALYEDLAPVETTKRDKKTEGQVAIREPGSGRPTKAERRALDKLRPDADEI